MRQSPDQDKVPVRIGELYQISHEVCGREKIPVFECVTCGTSYSMLDGVIKCNGMEIG